AKETGELLYDVPTHSTVAAPPAQHGETAYLVSQDYSLYAVDTALGRLLWRFAASSPISRRPWVTDEDIYLAPDQGGLIRLERESGREIWRNTNAWRFLATNPKYVYAADRHERLLVLDRNRGAQLGIGDTRDFLAPIANPLHDRLFLGANDGLLVCLHDRA